jgi:hypothetical protein
VLENQDIRDRRDSLAWLRGTIDLAFVDLVPPQEIPDWVLASEDFSHFFDPSTNLYDLRSLIEVGVEEARARRKKHGLE